MNGLSRIIHNNEVISKLIISLLILFVIFILVRLIIKVLHRVMGDVTIYYKTRKTIYYFASFTYMIIMLFLWLEIIGSLSTYMGLLSAGMAVALKDLFTNIAAWFFIMIKKPFKVGDRIFINGQRGDVIDIRIFQFSLLEITDPELGEQSTGRIIDIPNNFIFIHPIVNAVKGFKFVWNEIQVEITLESDWRAAKYELTKIINRYAENNLHVEKEIKEASKRYMIYYNKYTPIVYTTVSPSGVILTLRYLCRPKSKRQTENDVWEAILDLINSRSDIDLAYPTRRVVN